MKFRFKPEDFENSAKVIAMKRAKLYGLLNFSQMAEVANVILEEHEKTLPVVAQIEIHTNVWFMEKELEKEHPATYRALLWGVEEIKK